MSYVAKVRTADNQWVPIAAQDVDVSNLLKRTAETQAVDLSTVSSFNYPTQLSNRNFVYNSAFELHQRGTSVASITGSGVRTADRWAFEVSTLGTWTQTIENDAPTGSGLRKSWKILCSTAQPSPGAASRAEFCQKFEGIDMQRLAKGTASAQQLTLSFWVKSNVIGTYAVVFEDNDNARMSSNGYSITAANTWERKVITIPADTVGVLDNDTNQSFRVVWGLAYGSNFTSGAYQPAWGSLTTNNYASGHTNLAATINNYWQITGVQMELGATATPFEHETLGTTFNKCSRYYFRRVADSTNAHFAQGWTTSTTNSNVFLTLPCLMRITPVLDTSTVSTTFQEQLFNNTAYAVSNIAIIAGESSRYAVALAVTHSAAVANTGSFLRATSTAGYLGFSAEF